MLTLTLHLACRCEIKILMYTYVVGNDDLPTFSLEGNAAFSGATPNAFESKSECLFQVNAGTLFSLGDAADDLCASFSAEL